MSKPKIITMSGGLRFAFYYRCPVALSKDECWLWQGSFDIDDNRGRLYYKGNYYIAARISYMLHNNLQTFDLCALHHCDNPPCINPWHLFAGTDLDNVRDMMIKNRDIKAKGEQNGNSQLTIEQVLMIKKQLYYGASHRKIAKEFNVSCNAITSINTGKTWNHIKYPN